MKATLTSDAVMSYFDPLKETELTTDASPFGLSAILAQHTPGQTDRKIVAYISRSSSDVERRYSQTEKEALAIVWAMEKLYLYLSGGHFTLITECKPIEMILNNPASKPPARIARWYLRIQEFDFTIQHIKGTENPSDFLSRHVTHWPTVNNSKYETVANAYVNFLVNHAVPKAMTLSQIQEATTSDSTLQYLIMLMRSNKWDSISNITGVNVNVEELKLFSKLRNELTVNDASNLLLRDTRIVLPSSLRNTAIQIAHEGHQGLVKTKRLLRTKVWFPHIDRMVQNEGHFTTQNSVRDFPDFGNPKKNWPGFRDFVQIWQRFPDFRKCLSRISGFPGISKTFKSTKFHLAFFLASSPHRGRCAAKIPEVWGCDTPPPPNR